jgi:hypothetical protein
MERWKIAAIVSIEVMMVLITFIYLKQSNETYQSSDVVLYLVVYFRFVLKKPYLRYYHEWCLDYSTTLLWSVL